MEMFVTSRENLCNTNEDGFNRPVESIMRCEDFKSNFARRLSNRYISRTPLHDIKQDEGQKIVAAKKSVPDRVEKITPKVEVKLMNNDTTQNQSINNLCQTIHEDSTNSVMRSTELAALNMEVETLRWQLSQTEASRQMHLALLKQVVTFLNKIKEHMEKQDLPKNDDLFFSRALPNSFNSTDLPRSRSVVHVNKSVEYTVTPVKKVNSRKISKSINNVNAFKEYSNWSQSKLSLTTDTNSDKKLTEEISRLITLANTVLSTKLPDLSCSCTNTSAIKKSNLNVRGEESLSVLQPKDKLSLIEEDSNPNVFILNTTCKSTVNYDGLTNKYIETKGNSLEQFLISPSPLTCGLENEFASLTDIPIKRPFTENDVTNTETKNSIKRNNASEKSCDSGAINFIEDESGFSSMSSFQEIGIPIINIIPPTPSREDFTEELHALGGVNNRWEPDDELNIEKQSVKVFWV